jgi:hypothetical protein
MARHHPGMGTIRTSPQLVDLEHPEVARALLRHIVDGADIVGQDPRGRPIMRFEFAAEPWLVDKLAALGAAEEDREEEAVE